jgi:hypothetical protein
MIITTFQNFFYFYEMQTLSITSIVYHIHSEIENFPSPSRSREENLKINEAAPPPPVAGVFRVSE